MQHPTEDENQKISKLVLLAKLGGFKIYILYHDNVKYRRTWIRSDRPWRIWKYDPGDVHEYRPRKVYYKTLDAVERGVMRMIA